MAGQAVENSRSGKRMVQECIGIAPAAIREAAAALFEARRSGNRLAGLPPSATPITLADAHAIQDELIAQIGEEVMGWKVSGTEPEGLKRGAILKSAILSSPARISAASVPLLGIEAEIAFRFDSMLDPREEPYTASEVIARLTAVPVIEVVDTRFESYHDTPPLHRLCDCMSNGALILGTPHPAWKALDLVRIAVVLESNSNLLHRSVGGHPSGDPLTPVVALANVLRKRSGISVGQIVTTGTYTGVLYAAPGMMLRVTFDGLGTVELSVDP